MKPQILTEKPRLKKTSPYMPAVTVIMPFDPKMISKSMITEQFNRVVDQTESMVSRDYDADLTEIAIQKLKRLARNLNYNTYKKSVVFFVSPVFEKVMYLDIPVEERIIISDHFDMKEVLDAKKDLNQYLLLLIHYNWSKLFLGNRNGLMKIQTNFPQEQWNYKAGELNHTHTPVTKMQMMTQFLKTADKGLKYLASVYQLPVFVIGRKEAVQQFREITENRDMILEYGEGIFEQFTDEQIHQFIRDTYKDWTRIRQEDIVKKMIRAKNAGKLATGYELVSRLVNQRRGHILILEKNYDYFSSSPDIAFNRESFNKFSHVKNPVDEMIGKLLEEGGDVEYADSEILGNYQHIALIQQG